MQTKGTYIPALTGIRAVAAYMVFAHHFTLFKAGTFLSQIAGEGHIGVTIFFVLSGFLIPLRYMNKVEMSRHWLKRYFVNRFARIYPLYVLVTIISFFVIEYNSVLDITAEWQRFTSEEKTLVSFLNLTLLRGFFKQYAFTGVTQGWTLTIEECFYATAPLLLLILARKKNQYLVLGFALAILLAIGCALVISVPHIYGLFDSYKFMFYRTFFGRCFEFILGVALALFVKKYPAQRKGIWLTTLGVAWVLASMVVLSMLSTPMLFSVNLTSGIVINNLVIPFGVGILFYGLISERTWLRRLLETSILQILGKSSYAFYLIHMGVVSVFILNYVSPNVYVLFLATITLGIVLWKWIEEPINLWLREKLC
jgi:peptidoglycan/LPS O-acetylase OafA/YrhL